MTNAVYIPSVDGKDVYLANHYDRPTEIGYNIRSSDGGFNLKRFRNTLDYSLDLLKLRDVYERVYRRRNFSFELGGKEYTHRVINVTAHYAVKAFNRIRKTLYIKNGWRYDEIAENMDDCVYVVDGELIAIQCDTNVQNPLPPSLLGKYFYLEDGQYKAKINIATEVSVAEIREELYEKGFYCDGIHYVRYKRSAGSSRVGKCLYIDERLYPAMHKWEMCGIKVQPGQAIDLAALESYIALTASSIVDTLEVRPENFLVIDDFESTFTDDVIATRVREDGHLVSGPEHVEITNSIWDGQSLMDKSLFGPKYEQYGMLLLRNRFFKSCCFNANIQQFLADHGITKIEQLNGFTLAKSIEDIKLITTPSSIKYLKFGRLREWLKRTDPMFGVVKHEKKTHFFDGRMVSTHYQLLNTLQMSQEEVDEFLEPSIEYMRQLKNNPAVMRYHLKQQSAASEMKSPLLTRNDIIFRLLGINDRFAQTQMYAEFRDGLIRSYQNNIRRGHVLVNGNYSTLVGNPLEMLKASIGQFDGESSIPVGHVMSLRFDDGQRLLGSRSPHVCQGNILLADNLYVPEVRRYMNLTEEIVCLNSIGENILQRLSGADFDSDTCMLTDDPMLIKAAEKNYSLFKVPTSLVESKKTKRAYTSAQQTDLDIKTSENMIGEIINLSQELNSLLWDKLNSGADFEDVAEIYYDTSMLDVMSGLEIDKAKKEFVVNNRDEYKRLKAKYERRDDKGRAIKPNFFGTLARRKGYYDSEKKAYLFHKTTMDYVQHTINRCRFWRGSYKANKPFSYVIDPVMVGTAGARYELARKFIDAARVLRQKVSAIYTELKSSLEINDSIDASAKSAFAWEEVKAAKAELIEFVAKYKCNPATMYVILRDLEKEENKDISAVLFDALFGTANSSFYDMIESSREPIQIATECLTGSVMLYGYTFEAYEAKRRAFEELYQAEKEARRKERNRPHTMQEIAKILRENMNK